VDQYDKVPKAIVDEMIRKHECHLDYPDPDDGFMGYVNADKSVAVTVEWKKTAEYNA
jgi:hypothetical protein